MPERNISKDDVERIVFGPDARAPYIGKAGETREFYGSLSDGRSFYVVTNSEITRVITVVDFEDELP